MSNIHIPGESIRTKTDAEKLLKDINVNAVSDGWKEHKEKLASKDKAHNKEIYKILKDRVRGRRFSIQWPDGMYEKIFPKGKMAGEQG